MLVLGWFAVAVVGTAIAIVLANDEGKVGRWIRARKEARREDAQLARVLDHGQVLIVRPGDLIIVRYGDRLPPKELMERVGNLIRVRLGDVGVLQVNGETEFSVLRSEAMQPESQAAELMKIAESLGVKK